MNETKHTPEPWRIDPGFKNAILANRGIAVIEVATVLLTKDCARIVQCVNACAGMEDPAAEIERMKAFTGSAVCAYCREVMPKAPDIILKHMETCEAHPLRDFQKICTQRDELLSALKPFANYACDPPCGCHNCIARAAIAKAEAEGGAQ